MSQRVKTSARGLVLSRSRSSPENGHLRKKRKSHMAKNRNWSVSKVRNISLVPNVVCWWMSILKNRNENPPVRTDHLTLRLVWCMAMFYSEIEKIFTLNKIILHVFWKLIVKSNFIPTPQKNNSLWNAR
jgi:hypothetical protein